MRVRERLNRFKRRGSARIIDPELESVHREPVAVVENVIGRATVAAGEARDIVERGLRQGTGGEDGQGGRGSRGGHLFLRETTLQEKDNARMI